MTETKKQTRTKTTKSKAAPKRKAAATKAKTKQKSPKEPMPKRVFAIRVTDEELAAIHRASGPRNATRFVRAVAAAFASENEGAFKAVLKEAREARS